jgi:DivIVA domain-containing protein
VDAFREEIRDTFLGATRSPVKSDDVRGKQFSSTDDLHYDGKQVDAFLDAAGIRLAAMESMDRPAGPLASGAILAGWADWADSTRFSTTAPLLRGYATAEVDAFREELCDTFLGVRQPPVVSGHVRSKQFSTHRPGYDKTKVDAFLEKAAWRLAAMESTDRPAQPQWGTPEDPHSLPSWPSPISESAGEAEADGAGNGAGDSASSHPGLVLPFVVFLGGLVVTVATFLAIGLPATRAERAIVQGPRVTATVSDVQQRAFYEDLLLTYSYDGQEYSVWRGRNDTSPPLWVGMTVQVSLDPADPGWAASETLDPTSAFVETFILVGSVLGPVSTVGAGILCVRRLSERLRARRTGHSAPYSTPASLI